MRLPVVVCLTAGLVWALAAQLVTERIQQFRLDTAVAADMARAEDFADFIHNDLSIRLAALENVGDFLATSTQIVDVLRFRDRQKLSARDHERTPEDLAAEIRKHPPIQAIAIRLTDLARRSGLDAIHLLDSRGLHLVRGGPPLSADGTGYRYDDRAYFKEAMATGIGRQFLVGAPNGLPGIFQAERVGTAEDPAGVVVSRIDITHLTPVISKYNAILIDQNGIVISSSDPARLYTRIPVPGAKEIGQAEARRTYGRDSFETLAVKPVSFVQLQNFFVVGNDPERYLRVERDIPRFGIKIMIFDPAERVKEIIRDGPSIWLLVTMSGLLMIFATFIAWAYVRRTGEHRWSLTGANEALSKSNRVLGAQNKFLAQIAAGANIAITLDEMVRWLESQRPDLKLAFMLVNRAAGTLTQGPAPSLPQALREGFDGCPIGPEIASCGTAAFLKKEVLTENIETDPNWRQFLNLVQPFGLRACWSFPLLDRNGDVLGTLSAYSEKPGLPDEDLMQLIGAFSATAAIALQAHADQERLRANQIELSEAKDRAVAANDAKTRFLATMSHELRTPMNAIIGFSQMMTGEVMGPIGNKTYSEYAGHILDSGRHLLSLINDVLDMSKIESGAMTLTEEECAVPVLIDDAVRIVTPAARRKNISLQVSIAPNPPALWADSRAMMQILLNLLTNAVKFTPPHGEVRVEARGDRVGGYLIDVIDTGIGIRPEDLERVFQPFEQGETGMARQFEGTGLGLAITRRLVEMHDGKIQISSELNKGTRLSIQLPVSRLILRSAE